MAIDIEMHKTMVLAALAAAVIADYPHLQYVANDLHELMFRHKGKCYSILAKDIQLHTDGS